MRMNILHISPQYPSHQSGREMAVLQSVMSMVENGYYVDYVGPKIEEKEIAELYRCCHFFRDS